MALKNGCYLPVHFSDDLKQLLEKFSDKIGIPQSRICEIILSTHLQDEVNKYIDKEEKYASKKKNA